MERFLDLAATEEDHGEVRHLHARPTLTSRPWSRETSRCRQDENGLPYPSYAASTTTPIAC